MYVIIILYVISSSITHGTLWQQLNMSTDFWLRDNQTMLLVSHKTMQQSSAELLLAGYCVERWFVMLLSSLLVNSSVTDGLWTHQPRHLRPADCESILSHKVQLRVKCCSGKEQRWNVAETLNVWRSWLDMSCNVLLIKRCWYSVWCCWLVDWWCWRRSDRLCSAWSSNTRRLWCVQHRDYARCT